MTGVVWSVLGGSEKGGVFKQGDLQALSAGGNKSIARLIPLGFDGRSFLRLVPSDEGR